MVYELFKILILTTYNNNCVIYQNSKFSNTKYKLHILVSVQNKILDWLYLV